MYLARDKNNDLYLFYERPHKVRECWWADSQLDGSYIKMDNTLYPEINWDSEPLEVDLVARKGSS